jgi:CO/xanthine dehydrogenase Mo-binding subunit
VRTPGIAFPGFDVEEVDVVGPPTSATIRGAGWVEAAVLRAAVSGEASITSPAGARASASVADGRISVTVAAGAPLDEVVLRSYCIGAAHQALGWVTSEGLAVDDAGVPVDLTIRSFGILRARDMPEVSVTVLDDGPGEAVNGSDAVFAAVAAAVWRERGLPQDWPCG